MCHVAYKTDVGKRRTNNQDAIKVNKALNLYVVADGMGGHQAGEIASQTTIEVVESHFEACINDVAPKTCITDALVEANKRVYLNSLEVTEYRGMGTTCSLVYLKDEKLYIGHVGDSRIYFVSDDITQMTQDHSLVEDLVSMGEITKEEAKVHPKRHVITRAIGTDPTVEIDYNVYDTEGIKKILICSDGLTEKVNDQEILNTINTHSIDDAVIELIQLANDRGGSDNTSVILLSLDAC